MFRNIFGRVKAGEKGEGGKGGERGEGRGGGERGGGGGENPLLCEHVASTAPSELCARGHFTKTDPPFA